MGFLAMLNTATATNPYILSVVLFVFACLCGLLNYTKWKYAAFLVGGCCTALPLHVLFSVLCRGIPCLRPALQVLNTQCCPDHTWQACVWWAMPPTRLPFVVPVGAVY